jgi:hypothetical protein
MDAAESEKRKLKAKKKKNNEYRTLKEPIQKSLSGWSRSPFKLLSYL